MKQVDVSCTVKHEMEIQVQSQIPRLCLRQMYLKVLPSTVLFDVLKVKETLWSLPMNMYMGSVRVRQLKQDCM